MNAIDPQLVAEWRLQVYQLETGRLALTLQGVGDLNREVAFLALHHATEMAGRGEAVMVVPREALMPIQAWESA